MTEKSIISKVKQPNTIESIANDLKNIGLESGMTVIVHSSLSSLGWVCGGPIAVVEALLKVITDKGTIVMATHSSGNSNPKLWENPPVPEEWWDTIKNNMPPFNPDTTPTRSMGQIAEAFRNFPGVLRSYHPSASFAAWGKDAQFITENHSLNFSMDEESPLARIYDKKGWILLLGVGHDSNTSLHLAEARSTKINIITQGGAIKENGIRVWKEFKDFDYDSDPFSEIGIVYEKNHSIKTGKVGAADVKLIPQRDIVDFTLDWYKKL